MVEEIIKERKSIREYEDKQIKLDTIHEIIDIARFAPSGKNRQPWKVLIVEQKRDLLNLFSDKFKGMKSPGSLGLSLKAIERSDKTLLIFNPYSYSEVGYSKNTMFMDIQSIGAFIQNILLLSTERGLSTLWINDIYYAKEEIERFFVNGDLEVVAAVCIGHSSKIKRFNLRNELNEILL